MQGDQTFNGVEEGSRQASHQITEPTNEVATPSGPSERRADLSLQIPPKPIVFSRNSSGKSIPVSQGSSRGISSPGGFLRGLSFKNKAAPLDGERNSLLNPDPSIPESPLANFISAISWKRCASVPVTPASNMSPSVLPPATVRISVDQNNSLEGVVRPKVSRSLSVPVRNVVIVRSGSFDTRKENLQTPPNDGQITPVLMDENDEEIPEEEAVCRICLIELSEGGKTLKMECSCKGDLRLTHEECAVKWFNIKGNKTCDICGQEVLNLPVTLLRVRSTAQRDNREERNRHNLSPRTISAWQDFVVLVLITTICYFFFLEQLLARNMKSDALVIAAPFSFTLSILGSIFAVVLATREYIWTYAALEFGLVAISLHVFYSTLRLKTVYAFLLSSIMGFGIAMSLNTLYLHIFAWRAQAERQQTLSSPSS